MSNYAQIAAMVALGIIFGFSALAARAQQALWRRCRKRDSCMCAQRLITLGKSHCR